MRHVAALALAATCGTTTVLAAEDAPVKASAQSLRAGIEFRAELRYNDNGLKKESGQPAPDKTNTLEVQKARVKLTGNIDANTEYKFRFNLLNPRTSPLDYGSATHWFGGGPVGLGIGRQKVLQGGWDQLDESFKTHAQGVYATNFAFSSYEDMVSLQVKAAGKITLQVLNDVIGEWNTTQHPTVVFGYQGDFGGVEPIFDFGAYDNQKSRWFDVGIKAGFAGARVGFDFMQHMMTHHAMKNNKATELTDNATSVSFRVAYEVKDTVMPWFYYSMYQNKEADDATTIPPSKDVKVNAMHTDTSGTTYDFDDNGMVMGVGADLLGLGKGWVPFIAIVTKSGKFASPTDPAQKEETKSEMNIKIGTYAEI